MACLLHRMMVNGCIIFIGRIIAQLCKIRSRVGVLEMQSANRLPVIFMAGLLQQLFSGVYLSRLITSSVKENSTLLQEWLDRKKARSPVLLYHRDVRRVRGVVYKAIIPKTAIIYDYTTRRCGCRIVEISAWKRV